ncbi:hypothetical protein DPMN_085126 [Dreissena polymorpha]|uniref:Uncharacterized protein n=1 Tax=Dreissena polymorpha TaxID=45954 RepID=A0A9D3YEG3_DREPO|nr:hypothetical protein DPMN_085126 [Dreissena polymorpha]
MIFLVFCLACSRRKSINLFYIDVFLSYFLQLNLPQKGGDDDTSANDIEFQCWDLHARLHTVPTVSNVNDQGGQLAGDTVHAPGGLANGNWASSNRCPVNSAICGIQTRVETFLSDRGDDSALNDVKFFCCQD